MMVPCFEVNSLSVEDWPKLYIQKLEVMPLKCLVVVSDEKKVYLNVSQSHSTDHMTIYICIPLFLPMFHIHPDIAYTIILYTLVSCSI
jgi:hypothetical protein